MLALGVTRVVECGPGKVLSGLARRIDKSLQTLSLEDPAGFSATLTELQ
jgi:[acyl-carrier-protein] S-malonyltransferase